MLSLNHQFYVSFLFITESNSSEKLWRAFDVKTTSDYRFLL